MLLNIIAYAGRTSGGLGGGFREPLSLFLSAIFLLSCRKLLKSVNLVQKIIEATGLVPHGSFGPEGGA
jgi:hypothetical protein